MRQHLAEFPLPSAHCPGLLPSDIGCDIRCDIGPTNCGSSGHAQ